MLGEPTFYSLATVFDDHSTCRMMLEHVWCSIKHLIQHRATFLLFSCWMREILFVWPVSTTCCSAGNNSRSSDIVRSNFENVRPISHYDRTRWPNMLPAHLEFSSSRCCQSINYVRSNLSNVRPKGRFERTYVLWVKKNYFQHWCCMRTRALWLQIQSLP